MDEYVRTEILDSIAEDRNEILEFTKTLVAIPSENPPGVYYRQCAEAIRGKLTEIGLDSDVIEVPDHPSSGQPRYCIQSGYGTGARTLYFHGHYDVVPASGKHQFNPAVKGANLYGRGSSDMKSGLAAMIYAVKAIRTAGVKLDGKIGLTIVPDEETGGLLGSKYLSDAGILGKNGIGMLIPEPTDGIIWNANRGAVSLQITVRGKAAHVGRHYRGSNAFEKMIAVANELMALKKEVTSRTTGYNIKPDPARQSILMMGGRGEGGSNFNLVPERFTFTLDRRINPEEDLGTEKKRLLDVLETLKNDGIDLDVEILQEGESAGVSEDTSLARSLGQSIESVTGIVPEFEMCPGLLEIRFYAKKDIPALAYGPGFLSVSHGPDEFVRIENIYTCAAVYALTALDLLVDKGASYETEN
jgi:succinyl-diaminopimelate desuccinylase